MACEMRLAVFAAEDLVRVQVGVVDEAHARGLGGPETCRTCFEVGQGRLWRLVVDDKLMGKAIEAGVFRRRYLV